MAKPAHEYRQEFTELGYTVFPGVVTPAQLANAITLFDGVITPQTKKPVVCDDTDARRQLNSGLYCVPALSNYAGLPAVLNTVAMLLDRPFRLTRSSVPTVTYSGKTGGRPEVKNSWSGHVDWNCDGEVNVLLVYGIMHFTRVEPGGGGFTVVPASHRAVAMGLTNSEVAQRMMKQEFRGVAGMGEPCEVTANAGDILYYHPLLVHGASDNLRSQTRKVLHTHYIPLLRADHEERDRKTIAQRFHADHLAVMDERFKKLIGMA